MEVEVYTRDGCVSCERVKTQLRFHGISFKEIRLDEDITSAEVKEKFPNSPQLPIVNTYFGALSGAPEVEKILNELKGDFGKELLIEEGL